MASSLLIYATSRRNKVVTLSYTTRKELGEAKLWFCIILVQIKPRMTEITFAVGRSEINRTKNQYLSSQKQNTSKTKGKCKIKKEE